MQSDDILQWPEPFVALAASALLEVRAHGSVPPEVALELNQRGLLDDDGRLTDLGARLAYHLAEFRIQSPPSEVIRVSSYLQLKQDSLVLDIGCGAGQTLFTLHGLANVQYTGVDRDSAALAWGSRLQKLFGMPDIQLICASAESIPFVDSHFTHVVSRVALNYVHQKTALREAVRVLKPGGSICYMEENIGYDLRLLIRARTFRKWISPLYEMGASCVATMTGLQAHPNLNFAAKRMFLPLFRLRRELRKLGCDVTYWKHLSSFLGFPISTIIVAKKRSG